MLSPKDVSAPYLHAKNNFQYYLNKYKEEEQVMLENAFSEVLSTF